MAIGKKSANKECWRGCGKTGTLLHRCWQGKLLTISTEEQAGGSSNKGKGDEITTLLNPMQKNIRQSRDLNGGMDTVKLLRSIYRTCLDINRSQFFSDSFLE